MGMKAIRALVVSCLAGLSALAGCSKPADEQAAGKVRVAATIFPLADLAEQVGGESVHVTCIVPPGMSPHGFELTSRGRSALGEARLVLSAGPTDAWLRPGLIPRSARHVELAQVIGAPAALDHADDEDHEDHQEHEGHEDHEGHRHSHAGPDPHYWLDPRNMAVLAEQMGEALAEIDPAHAADYRARAAAYAGQCRELAEEIRAAGAPLPHKVFVAAHPAYGHLAELMGLRQVASIEPVVGAAGTPGHLEALIRQVIDQKVPAIYVEPQLPARDAEAVRREAAARGWQVKVLMLDPMGNPSMPDRSTYVKNMRANVRALREGMQ